ncbi:MAG: hypothetical protein U1D55_02185 [Phycisphaerae bacterium]
MRSLHGLCLSVATLAAFSLSAVAGDAELRISRVALFSSGVGHYVCEADVEGDVSAELRFRSDQINDVIKSMIVQDLDGGRVGAIRYASQDPIDKQLKSFGVDITGKPTLWQLLEQLRGEPIEIDGATKARGLIVGVESQKHLTPDKIVLDVIVLTVLTDAGLQQVRMSDVQNLRLLNEKVDAELRDALETLATSHGADKKSVGLSFSGKGKRHVRVAYLLEAPLWKTTYRLALTDNDKPLLQGWATVENATDTDWKDVQLSLIAGRPISFRMDLYTPIYVPRPEERLEMHASLRPREMEADGDGMPELAFRASSQERLRDKSTERRGNAGLGRVVDTPAAPPAKPSAADGTYYSVDLVNRSVGVDWTATTTQETGDLFEYRIDAPVSIVRQQSAMLPIVNETVAGEKLSVFNPATHARHPFNAFRLRNSTKLHLMQGPITLFDANVYAGDAMMPDLKPGEERLIGYALDLAREVTIRSDPQPAQLVGVKVSKGTLLRRDRWVDQREYVVKNKDDKARDVLIEQPFAEPWKLIEPKEPAERTATLLRFKVDAAGAKTTTLKVVLEQVREEQVVISTMGADVVDIYLRAPQVSPAIKQAIEKVVGLRREYEAAKQQRELIDKNLKDTIAQQIRIRQNLDTLKEAGDVRQRQLTKFDQLETQIEQQQKQLDSATADENKRRDALETYVAGLELE